MHKKDKSTFYCDDCDFSCQMLSKLRRHINNVHNEVPNIYSCHCCTREYRSGGTLSKHLIKKHGFQLPSGHRRFTYQQGTDGIYRVQTTRIESLEVSKQIMATPVNDQTNTDNISYELNNVRKTENGFAFTIAPIVDQNESKAEDELEHFMEEIDSSESRSVNSVVTKKENTFKGKIEPKNMPEMHDINIPSTSIFETDLNIQENNQSELKSIDDFSVMKKYLKKKSTKNKIVITVDEVDEQGILIRRETRNATEYHL